MIVDLINSDDSQLGKMANMLESVGYELSEDANPEGLGHKEYAVAIANGRKMLILGSGRAGDSGCYTNFYFDLDSEELIEHCSGTE